MKPHIFQHANVWYMYDPSQIENLKFYNPAMGWLYSSLWKLASALRTELTLRGVKRLASIYAKKSIERMA